MLTLTTKVRIQEGGKLEASVPAELPPGEHEAVIVLAPERRRSKFRMSEFPVHYGDWDHSVSLRREDIYGDDGR